MRKSLCTLIFLYLATIALAQGPPSASSVCEIHTNKIKPGMTQQYEQGPHTTHGMAQIPE